eukprot:5687637-Pyramimonas_sp.AAC.1
MNESYVGHERESMRSLHVAFLAPSLIQWGVDGVRGILGAACPRGAKSGTREGVDRDTASADPILPVVYDYGPVQQGGYDTHSSQASRLSALLDDLRMGVHTFVAAAKLCGFWDDVAVLVRGPGPAAGALPCRAIGSDAGYIPSRRARLAPTPGVVSRAARDWLRRRV